MVYRIGMIEDDQTEATEIMLPMVMFSAGEILEGSFKQYDLTHEGNLKEYIFDEIKNDIVENTIQGLIVDYRLSTPNQVLAGIDIVKYVHEISPEFPMVILTNVPEEGKRNDFADPDKVYAKKDFIKVDMEASKSMVYNIIRNIARYVEQRSALELRRNQLVEEVLEKQYENTAFSELIDTELSLSRYVPMEREAQIPKAVNVQENVDEALRALKEYKELLTE